MACRMYAFDIHCNSYFPLFILLYGKLAILIPSICGSHTKLLSQARKSQKTLAPQTLSQQQGHVRLSAVSSLEHSWSW